MMLRVKVRQGPTLLKVTGGVTDSRHGDWAPRSKRVAAKQPGIAVSETCQCCLHVWVPACMYLCAFSSLLVRGRPTFIFYFIFHILGVYFSPQITLTKTAGVFLVSSHFIKMGNASVIAERDLLTITGGAKRQEVCTHSTGAVLPCEGAVI